MGAAESKDQVTPSRPIQNRHLLRVADPRSPSVEIPRTPIEVTDSPQRPSVAQAEEEVVEPAEILDPRSPTQGILRTPLRPSLHASLNYLAKQLSEVFVSEDSGIEGSPAADVEAPVASVEEKASDVTEVKEPAAEGTPMTNVSAEAPAEPPPSLPQQQRERGKSPSKSGVKSVRQRQRKALISSVPGRSPLKVLQEDNSPNTAPQNRQIKKISLQSETPSSVRMVKISHNSWQMSYNKENAQYTQSEG
ncbi:cell division cycle-associated protein 3 [Hyperolius riggenbachi]|uniref:cell division cycle-associated protein 3 n=1 Tax=Hyperolius riggenbachi TaxID=752182 RepID=UPI0035A2A781